MVDGIQIDSFFLCVWCDGGGMFELNIWGVNSDYGILCLVFLGLIENYQWFKILSLLKKFLWCGVEFDFKVV